MESNQSKKESIMTENKGRGLFYGVIAIATFIIMAVGATFAYFTATTNSMNSSVKTGSTTLQLRYISYGAAWMKEDLIPANDKVVEYSFEKQDDTTVTDAEKASNTLCKDDFGNSICSVYVFQVQNSSNSPQTVSLNVVSEENSFASLHAMAYEVAIPTEENALKEYTTPTDPNGKNDPVFKKNADDPTVGAIPVVDGAGTPINDDKYEEVFINRKGVIKTLLQWVKSTDPDTQTKVVEPAMNRPIRKVIEDDIFLAEEDRTVRVADEVEIEGGSTKTFALVLYIKNENRNQTETDAEKSFTGKVIVSSGDGSSGVSGSISVLTTEKENELQSNTQGSSEPAPGPSGDDDTE